MTKILVIENDRETREILLECLKLKGFEVISAENGLQGVEQAHIHLPDVIICDVTLPKLDGYGVLKTLRQNLNTAIIPLILLTDKSSQQEMRQGMELGANDYLVKPFTPKELLGAIAAQVKQRYIFQQWFAVKSQNTTESPELETDDFAKFAPLFASCCQLKTIYEFIETHYHESIALKDVAKHFGFSAAYLTELVKNQTGEPINRWIIKRRVTAARNLLLKTEKSVEQIAEAVGYQSLNHFFRQFRQYYGNSPKAWRKANLHNSLSGYVAKSFNG
jgi:YesN/AraC family two-component response regulator